MAIVWSDEKRRLGDLLAWPKNPRQIDRKQAARLVESFDEFGQVETLAVGPANELYNGHQRLNVLMHEFGPDCEVDVRVSSRALTEREREKLTIYLHKGAAGTWDFDILADAFEVDDLLAWGFEPFELGLGDLAIDLDDLDDEPYSREIKSPVYQPANVKPQVSELFDESKTLRLVQAIQAAQGLPDNERAFLIAAAQRHTVFHFNKIADYYAHSDEATQAHIEDSALVIIDFNRAIELGYVALTKNIADQVKDEYGE